MSIIIGADIVPTKSNKDFFSSGKMISIVGNELTNLLKIADYRIFNLECPLINNGRPIEKCGPVLKADTSTVNGLKSIDVNLLTLANNHIMDYGEDGLNSTIEVLKKNGISFLGVGCDVTDAASPHIFQQNGMTFGVYACAEHEFSIVDERRSGANPFDALESFDHVAKLKEKCDFIIVLYHGGKEHYRYPSPMLQRICRKFVKKGANLVICQHSHCIGCEEKYLSGTIVYGQGNFILKDPKYPTAQTSLLVKIDDSMSISYIPLVAYENGVRLAEGTSAESILSEFKTRSIQIKQDGFLEMEYKKFARKKIYEYGLVFSGFTHKIFERILIKLLKKKVVKYLGFNTYKKHELLAIQNYVECEAHRELLLMGLKNYYE